MNYLVTVITINCKTGKNGQFVYAILCIPWKETGIVVLRSLNLDT